MPSLWPVMPWTVTGYSFHRRKLEGCQRHVHVWCFYLPSMSTYGVSDTRPSKPQRTVPKTSDAQAHSNKRPTEAVDDEVEIAIAGMPVTTKTFHKEVLRRFHDARCTFSDGLLQASPYRRIIMQHFVAAFFNPQDREVRPNAWVYELPPLMSDHSSSLLVYSVRAASMAHFVKRTGDMSMQMEACR